MKRFYNLKIATKLVITIAVVMTFALAVTGIISYLLASSGLQNSVQLSLKNRASDNANNIGHEIELIKSKIEGEASKASIQGMVWDNQKLTLDNDMKTLKFASMGIADTAGNIKFADATTANISDKDYFKSALNGTLFFSDPLVNQTTNKLVITIAAPIYSSDKVVGVLLATMDYSILNDMIKDIKEGSTGYAFIINKQCTTVAHPDEKLVIKQDNDFVSVKTDSKLQPLVNLEKKMINGETGCGQYEYNNKTKFMAYAPITGTSWFLAIGVPKAELFSSVDTLKNSTILFTFLFILVGIIAILLITKKIIENPIKKLVGYADRLAMGDIDVDIVKTSNDEIGVLTNSFDKMAKNVKEQALVAEKIASGDVNVTIEPKSDKDILTISLLSVIKSLKELSSETDMLIAAAGEGNFAVRGDESKFKGQYASMIIGENQLLDEVTKSFEEVKKASDISKEKTAYLELEIKRLAENLSRLSEGELDLDLDVSEGNDNTVKECEMFCNIRNNLQQVKQALNNLIEDAEMLTQASVEGKLSIRADATRHQGKYRSIIDGVNNTLEAVVAPLSVAAGYVDKISKGDIPEKITDIYNGDFNVLINNLNSCIDAVNNLITDTNMLSAAAVEGKLSTRADVTKHKGDYRKIIEGINETLDAVIEPINEVSAIMEELSQGHMDVSVSGDYKGNLAELKDSVNDTAHSLHTIVNEITYNMTEIAKGNLNLQSVKEYKGDFYAVSDALNTIVSSLNEILSNINTAAEQVSVGSEQVSAGSQSLSQGATEQASSIQELSSSIAEVAAQIKENADNSKKASEFTLDAKTSADAGNNKMKVMLKSMSDINVSSSNISKVIKVIDDIAFQTNILALNAAVEAARAGQYGKGFAVVAEEVRNLAAKSASAAKETAMMIESSIQKADEGTKMAEDTAEAFAEIVTSVERASNLVAKIASASSNQATGIAQINLGVEQVSTVVQTNSATAEESAASSEELYSQADTLKEMVGKFSLKEI